MELKGADGSVIASLNAEGAHTDDFKAFSQYLDDHIFINKGTIITECFSVFVKQATGLIKGSLGGGGEVKLRNSMEAYGEGVPEVFANLTGTWTGTYTNACANPATIESNELTISQAGVVTLVNTGSQDCNDVFPQSFSWGGKDDFLIPDPAKTDGSYIMHVDATDFNNVSDGKLKIYFTAIGGIPPKQLLRAA